jgi:hypothetical protein
MQEESVRSQQRTKTPEDTPARVSSPQEEAAAHVEDVRGN